MDNHSSSISSAPLAWHDFLERMRHPSAADFVKSIKNFIISFSNKAPDPEKDSACVQRYLMSMEEAFRAHVLWAGSSEEEVESAAEGLEKYVMTKLFNRAFASLPEDVRSDEELFEKIALLQQFICPENLDIKQAFQNETSWLLAQKELQKINQYKAPRDKLMCILNCCKVINNLLLNVSIASDDSPPGADDFLSILIYVTIKANPPQLHSNLLYIQRYRCQSRLVSEVAYYFTNILSVESFICDVDAQSLSMDDVEFHKKMESARLHLLGLSTREESSINQTIKDLNKQNIGTFIHEHHNPFQVHDESNNPEHNQLITHVSSVSNLEEAGAIEILNDGRLTTYFEEYPYLHANAGDLTVDDVHNLLNCYKRLVLMYVTQSKGAVINGTFDASCITRTKENFDASKESDDGT